MTPDQFNQLVSGDRIKSICGDVLSVDRRDGLDIVVKDDHGNYRHISECKCWWFEKV